MINALTVAHEHSCVKYFIDRVAWLMDREDDGTYELAKQIGLISFYQ
jgi:hypothetical protein